MQCRYEVSGANLQYVMTVWQQSSRKGCLGLGVSLALLLIALWLIDVGLFSCLLISCECRGGEYEVLD